MDWAGSGSRGFGGALGGGGGELLADLGEEVLVALAVDGDEGFFEGFEGLKAVGAEAAEAVAEFAPGDEGPDVAPEEQGHGAKAARRDGGFFVAVGGLDDPGELDGVAELLEAVAGLGVGLVAGLVRGFDSRGVEADGVDFVAQGGGEDGFNFAQGVASGGGQFWIAEGGDHAGTEDEGGDFAGIEHERGKVVIAAQGVAGAGFAQYRDAGELEVLDVAVDGAWGDFEFFGEGAGGLEASGAEKLDDAEESVGASHAESYRMILTGRLHSEPGWGWSRQGGMGGREA